MTNPLVTVAIPSYNHAKYIGETIQSALDQTFQDFEILIIDDASTDNTLEIIKSFNDPRIRLIISEKNSGVCETTNMCIAQAQGKYIALIASDDVIEKTKLEKQVNFLEKNPSYGAVFSGMEVIDEDGKTDEKKTKKYTKVFEKENRSRSEWLNYFFHNGNCMAAPSLMARTSALKEAGGFDFKITQAHDFNLWVKLCLLGHEIFIIPEKLLKYRERNNNGNLSSNTADMRIRLLFDNEKVLENFLKISSLHDLIKIFPDHKISSLSMFSPLEEKIIIDYLIFQEASKNSGSIYHMQFAINLIYRILSQDGAKEILSKNFKFDLKEYKNFITQYPLGVNLEKLQNPASKRFFKSLRNLSKKIFYHFCPKKPKV